MSRVGIITQARTTSTRLPGKVLAAIGGRTALDHHLDRLATSGLDAYVATTTNAADDAIVELADQRGVRCYRGSEPDVLARFHECATAHRLDVVVRVTSDCPLIDGQVVADAVQQYVARDDPDVYLSNVVVRTFPRGFDFEVFSADALAEAFTAANTREQREHVTPYLRESGRLRLEDWTWSEDKSRYRVTLDTADDLRLIRALVVDHHANVLDCAGIIRILDNHPELAQINEHVKQSAP